MAGPGGGVPQALRPACRIAVGVAAEGELAEPRVPSPPALRPVLAFQRFSNAAYVTIARVVDEDDEFRARVAERADEAVVGRAGVLWLTRPEGWEAELRAAVPGVGGRQAASGRRAKDDDAAARWKRVAADAQTEVKRLGREVADLRRELERSAAARDDLTAQLGALQEERNAAVRSAKALEAEVATARRDLKVARAATRQAEHELAAERAGGAGGAPQAGALEAAAPGDPALLQAVADAADAAAALASHLGRVAAAAGGGSDATATGSWADGLGIERLDGAPASGRSSARAKGDGGAKARSTRSRRAAGRSPGRRVPDLPPGVFDATPEAHRHLLRSPGNVVVVDGYNLARAAWGDLSTEEERRRTVAMLEDVQARSGARVVVVFDGETGVVAPIASKHVVVRFSETGQTADDLIADLVQGIPAVDPVVVVSSDRAVADRARRDGAVVIASQALLAAVRP